jgi:outer membrane lipoprotein-sorting protein
MTELAKVLSLLTPSAPRFRTLQVTGREWRNNARLVAAFLRWTPPEAGTASFVSVSQEDQPNETEDVWRIWVEVPDCMKVDFAVGRETVTAVFRGNSWWSWAQSQGVHTNDGLENLHHGKGPGEILLHPAALTPCLKFELRGSITQLGRLAYKVRGTPIIGEDDCSLNDLGLGADEYELLVDAELGVLLGAEARLDDLPFRILEITSLDVDLPLPASTFRLQVPGGRQF